MLSSLRLIIPKKKKLLRKKLKLGQLVLSHRKARTIKAWERVIDAHKKETSELVCFFKILLDSFLTSISFLIVHNFEALMLLFFFSRLKDYDKYYIHHGSPCIILKTKSKFTIISLISDGIDELYNLMGTRKIYL